MIIRLLAEKDTYVTNLNTQRVNGSTSNVGHSSTLDLYKLYNENKYSNSRAFLDFNSNNINNQSDFAVTDAKGKSLNIVFNTGVTYGNSSYDSNLSSYTIGISDKLPADYTSIIAESLNSVRDSGGIRINAYNNSTTLVLEQIDKGEAGDTQFNISDISNVVTSKVSNNNYFSRIDWSFILIKPDTTELISKWAKNGTNGIFTSGEFKAELVLKDVSTGLAKPKDYTVACYELNKSFDEGIGKDTSSFTDKDVANFVNLSSSSQWVIKNFITKPDDVRETLVDTFNVVKGNEDIVLDITSYVEKIIADPVNFQNHGLIISLDDASLYDNKTYFVKRLGSRHLLNKSLVPSLDIAVNDLSYRVENIISSNTSYKISDTSFDLYLVNDINNISNSFKFPTGYDTIKHEIKSADGTSVISLAAALEVTDMFGNQIAGIKKRSITVTGTDLLLPANFEAARSTGKLTYKSNWYFSDSNAVNSDLLIETKDIDIVYYNKDVETYQENLYVTIKFDKDLTANNSDYLMTAYLLDLKEKVAASRKPYNLLSKNVGDLFYRIIDKDSGKTLIDFNDNSSKSGTKLFYDGENYKAHVFIPSTLKNKKIHVEFSYKDKLNNISTIKNNNIEFSIK